MKCFSCVGHIFSASFLFFFFFFFLDFQVVYETLPGWKVDITGVRSYEELPKEAKVYVERIEELIQLPVRYIGVGPGRDALIIKE